MDTATLVQKIKEKKKHILLLGIVVVILLCILLYRLLDIPKSVPALSNEAQPSLVTQLSLPTSRMVTGTTTATSSTATVAAVVPKAHSVSAISVVSTMPLGVSVVGGKKFRSFTYSTSQSATLQVSGVCSDRYYTILIFNAKEDIIKNPNVARYNRAFLCPKSKSFSEIIDVTGLHLLEGDTYYVVAADQGTTGSWYNPR